MKRHQFWFAVSLLLCLLAETSAAANTTSTFPQAVINAMTTREMRYHHYLWHNMRNNWNNFTDDVKQQFSSIGWEPPRPATAYFPNGTSVAITDNNSGEDFLFMHRQMIAKAKAAVANDTNALAWLTGWTTLPAPGDKDYPVPANYTIPNQTALTNSTMNRKTDDFYNRYIKPVETTLNDTNQLKKMTLGQLGSRIEFTVHNYLHMRFSSNCSYGYRFSYKGTIPYIDPKWDDPQYNWLGDFYSSQVHPVFWRIHGWVDNKIEAWRIANNIQNITWNATWVGGPMSTLASVLNVTSTSTKTGASLRTPMVAITRGDTASPSGAGKKTMDAAMEILIATGQDGTFADDVLVPDFVPESMKYKPPKKTNPKKPKAK